jgi:hypothetical protein
VHIVTGAGILRDVGIDQVGERHRHRRLHVGVRRIHEARRLRIGARKVDLDIAAALGHLCGDADVAAAMAVVVEQRLAVEDAVLPACDDGARLLFGRVQNILDRLVDGLRIELGEQFCQPPLAEMRGADHCGQIAAKIAGVADVQRDHVEHVLAQPTGLVELHWRNAQAFLVDLGRHRIVGAVGRAADIALMRAHDRPEQPLAAVEHRHEGGDIRQVAAAVIGIVHQDHIARLHVANVLLHRAGGPGQGADMHRNVVGLRDQPRLRIADCQREIPAGVEDLRVRRAQHGFAHLGDDGAETVLDDGAGDGVDVSLHRLLTGCPCS